MKMNEKQPLKGFYVTTPHTTVSQNISKLNLMKSHECVWMWASKNFLNQASPTPGVSGGLCACARTPGQVDALREHGNPIKSSNASSSFVGSTTYQTKWQGKVKPKNEPRNLMSVLQSAFIFSAQGLLLICLQVLFATIPCHGWAECPLARTLWIRGHQQWPHPNKIPFVGWVDCVDLYCQATLVPPRLRHFRLPPIQHPSEPITDTWSLVRVQLTERTHANPSNLELYIDAKCTTLKFSGPSLAMMWSLWKTFCLRQTALACMNTPENRNHPWAVFESAAHVVVVWRRLPISGNPTNVWAVHKSVFRYGAEVNCRTCTENPTVASEELTPDNPASPIDLHQRQPTNDNQYYHWLSWLCSYRGRQLGFFHVFVKTKHSFHRKALMPGPRAVLQPGAIADENTEPMEDPWSCLRRLATAWNPYEGLKVSSHVGWNHPKLSALKRSKQNLRLQFKPVKT